jgi:LysM repeat protein
MSPLHLSPAGPTNQTPGITLVQDTNYAVSYVQAFKNISSSSNTYVTAGDRYWLSVPRRMDDPTWDVLLIKFRTSVSISQISFDLHKFAQNWEIWYYENTIPKPKVEGAPYEDPTGRIPVLDRSLRPLKGKIDTGIIDQWYGYEYQIRPVVARAIEIRVQRHNDGTISSNNMLSVGIRNLLFKRNIYTEQDAMLPLEDGVDPMGNLVQSYIKKWDPSQAVDGEEITYWRSAPQPAPDAIVCFYLDCRDARGNAQRIDRLYLDPTHSGSSLNLYYSADDTVGPRRLNLSRVVPLSQIDVDWIADVGLNMSTSTANYTINVDALNLNNSDSFWFAGTWIPGFNASGPPAVNLTLLTDELNKVQIRYRCNLNVFEVTWGSFTSTFPCRLFYQDLDINFSLRIVKDRSVEVGATPHVISTDILYPREDLYPATTLYPVGPQQYISGVPPGIYFLALDKNGFELSSGTIFMSPDDFPLPSQLSFRYCQGFIRHFFIKQDVVTHAETMSALWNMSNYLLPQESFTHGGHIQQFQHSSLSNMVYGADFTLHEMGFGGVDHLYFAEKEWSPIWMDWTAQKGIYYFPDVVYAKYIKLEFTDLTPEPYTIHDSGINVEYQTFPIEVTKINKSIATQTNTFINTLTSQVSSTRGVLYDNYYAISTAESSNRTLAPVYFVNLGTGTVGTVPRTYDEPISETLTTEIYTDVTQATYSTTSSTAMAADAFYTVVSGDWLIKIGKNYNIPWQEIYTANRSMIDRDPRVRLLPQRSPGWWIFPGQQLRIPNSIMEQITNTSTTTEKTISTSTINTVRNRFVKTQIHRYEYRTATRDAAMAYFAGVREIQVFQLDYTVALDTEEYNFPLYDTGSFSMVDMIQYDYSGAWKSTARVIISSELIYPQVTLFPSTGLFPMGSGTYAPSKAEWSDTDDQWSDTDATWGFMPSPLKGVVEGKTWLSLSLVNAIEVNVYDRGLFQPITGKELAPISMSDSPVGYWSSLSMQWSDTITVWGTRVDLVAEEFHSKVQWGGQSAYSIFRVQGVGVAGIVGTDFFIRGHSRVRVEIDYFRPKDTGNDLILQLVDVTTALGEYVMFQQNITEYYVGKWTHYSTRFYALGDYDVQSAQVRLIVSGSEEELVYIGRLYPTMSSIVYEYSNDGGAHYYEATEVVYSDATVKSLVFPSPDNRLRARVSLYDPEFDFIIGQKIVPNYI